MHAKTRARWLWISWLWLLVLLTGNLLHPLTHETGGSSSDCLVCTLQRAPALPDNATGEAARQSFEPTWESIRWTPFEPPCKPLSPYASHLTSRAPPIG